MLDKVPFIISIIIVFYISMRTIQNFSINFDALEMFIKEYKSGVIIDILATNNTVCPKNYIDIVQNFDWPGNYKGCGCRAENGSFVYYQYECPRVNANCFTVEETNYQDFKYWRNSLICYKRSNQSYSELNLVAKDNFDSCNNNTHRVCGKIDGLDNALCLVKNQECPIVNFYIINANSNLNEANLAYLSLNNSSKYFSGTKAYKLNSSNILVISNKEQETKTMPEFFRIDSTKPCLDPTKSPSSELFFPLMKNKYNLKCDLDHEGNEIVDNNFTPIDTYPLKDYFKDNKYYDKLNNIISPFDIDIDKKTVSIFSRGYPGWNLNCRHKDKEADSLEAFLKIEEVLNGMLISTIFYSFILIVILIAIGVAACFFSTYFDSFFRIVCAGFCILGLIYPIQIISNSNWIINILLDDEGLYCGDQSINILLADITASCSDLQISYMMILLICIVFSLLFVYSLYKWLKPYHKEYQERLYELR